MKRIFNTLLLVALAAGFTACGSKSAGTTDAEKAGEAEVTTVSENDPAAFDPNTVAIGVVELDNDDALRPDIKTNHPIVIDFNATWCGPCQQFKPAFDAAAEKFAGQVEFVSVDVDNNPNTAQAFGVTGIPHVVILAPGKNTQNFVGTDELLPQDKFFKLVEAVL